MFEHNGRKIRSYRLTPREQHEIGMCRHCLRPARHIARIGGAASPLDTPHCGPHRNMAHLWVYAQAAGLTWCMMRGKLSGKKGGFELEYIGVRVSHTEDMGTYTKWHGCAYLRDGTQAFVTATSTLPPANPTQQKCPTRSDRRFPC